LVGRCRTSSFPPAVARPKATVQDSSGALWIAKFPSRNDVVDVGLWEYLIHQLAEEAGITLSSARIEKLSETGTTFLVKRFDRTPDNRRVVSRYR